MEANSKFALRRKAHMPTITINDVVYDLDDLSDEAKQQIMHIEACKNEINRSTTRVAICQTAQKGYERRLTEILDTQGSESPLEGIGDNLTFD